MSKKLNSKDRYKLVAQILEKSSWQDDLTSMFTERAKNHATETNNPGLNRAATLFNSLSGDIHKITPELQVIKELPKIHDYWMRGDFDHCILVHDPNIIEPQVGKNEIAEETSRTGVTINQTVAHTDNGTSPGGEKTFYLYSMKSSSVVNKMVVEAEDYLMCMCDEDNFVTCTPAGHLKVWSFEEQEELMDNDEIYEEEEYQVIGVIPFEDTIVTLAENNKTIKKWDIHCLSLLGEIELSKPV
jgi:WD40 repeat protein